MTKKQVSIIKKADPMDIQKEKTINTFTEFVDDETASKLFTNLYDYTVQFAKSTNIPMNIRDPTIFSYFKNRRNIYSRALLENKDFLLSKLNDNTLHNISEIQLIPKKYEKYLQKENETIEHIINPLKNLPTSKKDACPKCNQFTITSYAVYERSADEGANVYYRCNNCPYVDKVRG